MTDDSMKTKIRKLLDMTEQHGCTEAEAAVALEKAQKLLAAHNLTEVEVRGVGPGKNDHRERDVFVAYPWCRKVAEAVAKLYDCKYRYMLTPGDKSMTKAQHFFTGRQSNAETANLIAQFAVKTVLKLAKAARDENGAAHRFQTDFAQGCAARVCVRARELWREANRELIETQQRALDAKNAQRRALEPDRRALLPGAYRIWLYTAKWKVLKDLVLPQYDAQTFLNGVFTDKPKNVTYCYIQCVDGALKSDEVYGYYVRMPAQKAARDSVKDRAAYLAGTAAGNNVGLHAQMDHAPAKRIA